MAVLSRVARPRNVALAAVLAANGALAQTCFNIQGFSEDATVAGSYLEVSSGGTDTYTGGFTDANTDATIFSLGDNGVLSDLTDPDARLANIDAGFTFDYLFFDSQATMDQFDQLALACATDDAGALTCAASDNSTIAVFNYCDGVLAISDAVKTENGCQGITLATVEASCPPPTEDPTPTDAPEPTDEPTDVPEPTDEPEPTDGGASTDLGAPTSTDAAGVALTTSTVFATETVTITDASGATSIASSVVAVSTTVCPVANAAAVPTGTGSYGGNSYASGSTVDPNAAPVYYPAHLNALPTTVCSSQLNAVAAKYPAGAMNSYSNWGVTVVQNNNNNNYGSSNAAAAGNSDSYGSDAGSHAAGQNGGSDSYNSGSNSGSHAAGSNVNNAGYSDNSNVAAAANNGSVAGAAAGTGAWNAKPTSPIQYEGSASTAKLALGGVLAAVAGIVCLM